MWLVRRFHFTFYHMIYKKSAEIVNDDFGAPLEQFISNGHLSSCQLI
jgi:hypothetical protein